MSGCPHENILDCPLYLASHIAGAGGCDDGKLHQGGCAVDRGLSYQKAARAFLDAYPYEVAALVADGTSRRRQERANR